MPLYILFFNDCKDMYEGIFSSIDKVKEYLEKEKSNSTYFYIDDWEVLIVDELNTTYRDYTGVKVATLLDLK